MAASLGLGHETYTYPPAASMYFPPHLELPNDCAAQMNFLPPAAMAADHDYFRAELGVQPPEYYSPPQVFAENEMNMRFLDDGTRVMVSRAAGENGGHHRATPSRIGFRTRSEVDVLDDGFKWRKYGKKAVKSSPNPRNYYRCSVEGCGVKKRVERDCHDQSYVITTYDGVHNHAAGSAAAAGYHHSATPQPAAPYAAATTLAAEAPSDIWGMQQMHAAAMAHSSESSY